MKKRNSQIRSDEKRKEEEEEEKMSFDRIINSGKRLDRTRSDFMNIEIGRKG